MLKCFIKSSNVELMYHLTQSVGSTVWTELQLQTALKKTRPKQTNVVIKLVKEKV